MTTTTQPPDLAAHLDAAERAAATVVGELQSALAAVPDGDAFSALRFRLVEHIALAARSGDLANERAVLAEIARPKGTTVTIVYPSRHGPGGSGIEELAEVTSGSLVMRRGVRFSRKTGRKAGHTDCWTPCPYITAEERTRVLALPRPPAAATAAKKAPK